MTDERTVNPGEEVVDVGAPDEVPEVEIVSFGDDEPDAEPSETESLRAELDEAQERHLRLRADFDNYRKRVERAREEAARTALAEPMRELLPVLDNLERALAAPGGADELRRGVELIARQFADVLRRFGLEEIPAEGRPFDPQVHEAVSREESGAVEVPTVTSELQRGYWLNNRLLRPAMVRVAVPVEEEDEGAAPEGDQE